MQHDVDNNQNFLEKHIIMISEDHVTLKMSNDAENTDLITEINYSLLYIHTENSCSTLQ